MRRLPCLLLLAFLAVAIGTGQAQQDVQPWNSPHFSVAPEALYQAASAVKAPDDANVALLVDDESFSFDEAGRIVHVGHFVYKVLNSKGAEGWDSFSVSWDPWHESKPVIRARVIAPDYSVHNLDPASITEEPARGGDYQDIQRRQATARAVARNRHWRCGGEESQERETEPFFAPGRVGWTFFGHEQVPVAHSRVVFDAPSSLPLRTSTHLMEGVKPSARRPMAA